jgi:acyl carrier protein
MNNINQFIENFLNACDFQNPVEVTIETELLSLPEWDSIAGLAVIVMFDIDYGKAISGEMLKNSITVGDLFRLLG